MANEITGEQRDQMRFRRAVIKHKLRNLEDLITGRTASFKPLITDADGKVSGEKTEKFINEMLGSLRRYVGFGRRGELGEDTIKMYESFLYCAVMGLSFERSRRSRMVWNWKRSSSFEDIIRLAENVEPNGCGSYNGYLRDCYRIHRETLDDCRSSGTAKGRNFLDGLNIPVHIADPVYIYKDSDFFIGMKQSLSKLGFPVLVRCLPEKTLERLRIGYEQNVPDPDEKMEQAEVPELKKPVYNYAEKNPDEYGPENVEEDYNSGYDEQFDYDPDFFDYDYNRDPDKLAGIYQEEAEQEHIGEALGSLGEDQQYSDSKNLKRYSYDEIVKVEQKKSEERFELLSLAWENSVVFDKTLLCGHFYRFLWLYLDNPDRGFFASDVENMADTFLCEQSASAFSLGDNYAMVNHYVDQMKNRIEREIGRNK